MHEPQPQQDEPEAPPQAEPALPRRSRWRRYALALLALVVAVVAAALAGAFMLVRHGRKSTLPFGPFLAVGAAIAVFAGEPLLHTYLNTL